MLFKLADQPFEDVRVTEESWPQVKKTIPMGLLPILDIDGVVLHQSHAIDRYLAKQYGYAGKSDLEAAQIDAVVGSVEDLTTRIPPIYDMEEDPQAKAKYIERYKKEFVLPGLAKLEKLLETNNGGNGFFVGDSLTWADLFFVNIAEYAVLMAQTDLNQFPKLKALRDRVETVPKIAAWIEERPKTEY